MYQKLHLNCASRTVGREFASWPGHTKDHHKNGTNCMHACVRVGVWQCSLAGIALKRSPGIIR